MSLLIVLVIGLVLGYIAGHYERGYCGCLTKKSNEGDSV